MEIITHPVLPYRLSYQLEDFNFDIIHAFLTNVYWSKGIPKETVIKSFHNSISIVLLTESNETIGAARMTTDRATFAYLGDVFILEQHRGQKLAEFMVGTLMQHPDLQGLRRLMLATRDMQSLYRKLGFNDLKNPDILMEIVDWDVYQKAQS
ncbi:N-acetyltransferase [Kordiimonas sediminis]|uniref:N-acetyltransferase n=1 Tax=Kordiimonas sediminis TaxID=1735581 RepID=A0A919AW47_9PROT|nr:GNAT family N-acetyltransferase [Kordiimonas sediminis]GHF27671.1 N-acetyltransferase [Kordiimonas sediminis]